MSKNPLDKVTFRCIPCAYTFDAEPARIEDHPEVAAHPWAYFAPCPHCEEDCAEIAHNRNIRLGWGKSGPSDPYWLDGKRTMTPEQRARNKFNALKHGMYAREARFFPAHPGSKWCDGCEINHDHCRAQPACIRDASLVMRHVVAFQNRDPAMLREEHALLHGRMHVMLGRMMHHILQRGVALEAPRIYIDQEHGPKPVLDADGNQLIEITAHPLIKQMIDLIQKMGMTFEDLGMTEKQQTEEKQLAGYLDDKKVNRESMLEHQERQTEALENLGKLFEKSREQKSKDPVLLEYARDDNEQ